MMSMHIYEDTKHPLEVSVKEFLEHPILVMYITQGDFAKIDFYLSKEKLKALVEQINNECKRFTNDS